MASIEELNGISKNSVIHSSEVLTVTSIQVEILEQIERATKGVKQPSH